MQRLADVSSALAALNRDGLGNYGVNTPEWHVALQALGRAKLEPTADNVEAARVAFRIVVLKAGALLDG